MRRVAPLLALVIVTGLAISALASPRGGTVHIAKIAFDPPGADNGSNASLNKETVVIVNGGSTSVVMTGWTLRDRDAHVFRFPTFSLRAGARVTVHNGQGSDNAANLYWDSDGKCGTTTAMVRRSVVGTDRVWTRVPTPVPVQALCADRSGQ
jgi:hypothetical protein